MQFRIVRHLTLALVVLATGASTGCSAEAEPAENLGSISENIISVLPNSASTYIFSNATSGGIMKCPAGKVLVGLESFNWALCAEGIATGQTNCAVAPPVSGVATCPNRKYAAGFKSDGSLWCCGGDSPTGPSGEEGINNVTSGTSPLTTAAWTSYYNPNVGYNYEMAHCQFYNDAVTGWKKSTMQFGCRH